MTRPARFRLLVTGGVFVLVLALLGVFVVVQQSARNGAADAVEQLPDLAAGARVLDAAPRAEVTVTEFLDFECESCGVMYPVVDDLRERYDGRVAFAFRYFPLPGHRNSMNAALAVEAAARQGRLEAMFDELFTTQAQWGEASESRAPRFRAAAERLGLDMDRYDSDVADPEVRARIERDVRLGRDLGVEATPTFFIDGEPVTLQRTDDLERSIVEALGR